MVLHQAFCARHVRNTGIGGEVRRGVTSGVSCETSLNKHVTPHLHREFCAEPPGLPVHAHEDGASEAPRFPSEGLKSWNRGLSRPRRAL